MVAINAFPTDSQEEVDVIQETMWRNSGVEAVVATMDGQVGGQWND